MKKILIIILFVVIFINCRTSQFNNTYQWKSLPIGSKSQVTGIIAHPQQHDLVYIRTFSGKIFRWIPSDSSWQRLNYHLDHHSNKILDVESFALDPNDPKTLFIACTPFDQDLFCPFHFDNFNIHEIDSLQTCILKTTDDGKHWEFCSTVGKLSGKTNRTSGEKIAIDPVNSDIVYYLSESALYRSTQAGKANTWESVQSFADVCSFEGEPAFVIFHHPQRENAVQSDTIYVGIKKLGIFQTTDAGQTWQHMKSLTRYESRYYSYPIHPERATINAKGELFVTHETSVSKWTGEAWLPIPHIFIEKSKQHYLSIDVCDNDESIFISSAYSVDKKCDLYFSKDSATSWTEIAFEKSNNLPFMPKTYWAVDVNAAMIDPHNPGSAWFADSYGVWHTDSLFAKISKWKILKKGQEQVCVLNGISTPTGSPLLIGTTHLDGIRYENFKEFPSNRFTNPNFTETTGIDFCEADPNFVARVGSWRFGRGAGSGGISVNNGKSWVPFIQIPFQAKHGRIAYSAQTPGHFVWLPFQDIPYVTRDHGKTWTATKGAPVAVLENFWSLNNPLASDRVNGNIFYLYHDGGFYRSDDGAATWKQTASMPSSNSCSIQAVPNCEKEVWLCLGDKGLRVTHDAGDSFEKIENVTVAERISFGVSPTGEYPIIFLWGQIGKHHGLFRSDNAGKKWLYIPTDHLYIHGQVISLIADRQIFGRIFIGTAGDGGYIGQLQ